MKKGFFLFLVIFSLNSFAATEPQGPALKLDDPLPANLFVELTRVINPAVVNIATSTNVRSNLRQDDPMLQFLERFYGPGFRPPQAQPSQALGTGFIIREDGLIITNNHVIDKADEIKVFMTEEDDKGLIAEVVGRDARTDIALLKIKTSKKLPFAILGSSKDVQVGEWVAAFGNPYGHGHTVTKGIISAKGREIGELNRFPFLQTDASINPGNSGGPLVNSKGLVIGVNSAIDARAQGIGFAIPIDNVKTIINDLEKNGKVRVGYLGVSLDMLNPRIAAQLGIKQTEGVIVTHILPNSPADKGGIKTYDVILEFNGKKLKADVDLTNAVASTTIGARAKLKILRDNKEQLLEVTVAERPEEKQLVAAKKIAPKKGESSPFSLGFKMTNIDSRIVSEFAIDESLTGLPIVIEVDPSSPAAQAGLAVGDVIFDVNRKRIRNTVEATKFLKSGTNTLRIQRGNSMGFIIIEGQ